EEIGRVPILAEFGRVLRDLASVEEKALRARAIELFREVDLAVARIERTREAALPRRRAILLPEMPLARHGGEVAGVAQHFRDRHATRQELAMKAAGLRFNLIVQPT